jgi:hypothetical protein
MMYIVHVMNSILVEHFYFKRSAPCFHPLIFRIYFGTLFFIQTLRASHAANALDSDENYRFLDRFLENYPPEILSIPAPLLHIFKSISSSRPEISQLGYIVPIIPSDFLGNKFKDGLKNVQSSFMLPDIPGILSLIQLVKTLDGKTTDLKTYFGDKINDRTFHGITFGKDPSAWNTRDAFTLRASGLEYLPEGVKSFHKSFVDDRLDELSLPVPAANDKFETLQSYLYLDKMAWFSDLIEMASSACKFFPGSGSLADCNPSALPTLQIQVSVDNANFSTKPTGFVTDNEFYINTQMQLATTSRTIDHMSMIMASASHINCRIKGSQVNIKSRQTGEFWNLLPIEKSQPDESALYSVKTSIKKMILDKSK